MPSKKDEKPNPLPIKEIYLSPRTPEEFERAKIGLQYLLKKNGHKLKEEDNVSGIEIKPSSIPLRIQTVVLLIMVMKCIKQQNLVT